MKIYMLFISYSTERSFPILLKSICFYFMWKRTHFPLRDFIQQEVFLGKTGSHTEKQVWTCLVKTGNESSLIAIMSRSSDSRTISHQPIKNVPINYFFR